MTKLARLVRKIRACESEATAHLLLATYLEPYAKEHALVDELCTAVDNAEADIGGSRPVRQILGELGPAWDAVEAKR